MLQRKFDEFQKDMATQEFRVSDVCETADRLYGDQHPESEIVIGKTGHEFCRGREGGTGSTGTSTQSQRLLSVSLALNLAERGGGLDFHLAS